MVELDEAMRRALSDQYGPIPGAKARVLDGLRAQLGGPGGPDGPDGPDGSSSPGGDGPTTPAGTGQAAWAAKVVAATLSLTGAGLLNIKLGALVLASFSGPSPTQPNAAAVTADTPPMRAPAQDTSAPEPSIAPAGIDPAAAPTQIQPAPANSRGRELATPSQRAPNPGDLAAELALVRAAERWREQDPHAALAKLEQHRVAYATGALAPEREVLRVELLCALGRREQASAARDAFMATHNDPQLRARIDASCVGTGSEQSGH